MIVSSGFVTPNSHLGTPSRIHVPAVSMRHAFVVTMRRASPIGVKIPGVVYAFDIFLKKTSEGKIQRTNNFVNLLLRKALEFVIVSCLKYVSVLQTLIVQFLELFHKICDLQKLIGKCAVSLNDFRFGNVVPKGEYFYFVLNGAASVNHLGAYLHSTIIRFLHSS